MAVLMILGDIKPRFYIVSISESKLKKQEATITDSEGCMVKAVNDMPFVDFLSDAGLTMDGGMEATAAVPFLIGYCDGTQPLARSLYSITPEGYGLFGCLMPSHAPLWMGTIDYIDIMETTSALMQKTMESENISCVLMFPCLSRSLLIEPNADHEMRKVMEIIGGRAPYHLAYVGGEMCPVYDEGGVARNRFHNFTYTVCVF